MSAIRRLRFAFFFATVSVIAPTTQSAQADLFLEPGLTFQAISDADISYPAPFAGADGEMKGIGLMGRIGARFADIFFLAADGRWANLNYQNSLLDSSGSSFNYGITGGMQMPIAGLRGWAGWIIGGNADPGTSAGFDGNYKSGSGWRLGAGFYILFVSLNLEYQEITYDSIEVESIGPFAPATNLSGVQLKDKAWVLSLSLPLGVPLGSGGDSND